MTDYTWQLIQHKTTSPVIAFECIKVGGKAVKGTIWSFGSADDKAIAWQAGIGELVFPGFHTLTDAKTLVLDEIQRRLDAAYKKRYGKDRPTPIDKGCHDD